MGVGWIIFSMVMFAISAISFVVVFVALVMSIQLWLAATIALRLVEGAYIRAALWSCVLTPLLSVDIAIWF
jgi:hypothetical protein